MAQGVECLLDKYENQNSDPLCPWAQQPVSVTLVLGAGAQGSVISQPSCHWEKKCDIEAIEEGILTSTSGFHTYLHW